jgi:hypothetical protein
MTQDDDNLILYMGFAFLAFLLVVALAPAVSRCRSRRIVVV